METVKQYLNAATAAIFVVAFAAGYGVSWYVQSRGDGAGAGSEAPAVAEGDADAAPAKTGLADAPSPVAAGMAAAGGSAVSAEDQAAGKTVTVSVTLGRAAWVAIHEDAGAKPGKILGARLFGAGGAQRGAVELLRPTEAGKKYYAMLHADDGDKKFDHTKDMPLAGAAGAPIMHAFMTLEADVQ